MRIVIDVRLRLNDSGENERRVEVELDGTTGGAPEAVLIAEKLLRAITTNSDAPHVA